MLEEEEKLTRRRGDRRGTCGEVGEVRGSFKRGCEKVTRRVDRVCLVIGVRGVGRRGKRVCV